MAKPVPIPFNKVLSIYMCISGVSEREGGAGSGRRGPKKWKMGPTAIVSIIEIKKKIGIGLCNYRY